MSGGHDEEGGSTRLGRRALLGRGAAAGLALTALAPTATAEATPPPGGTYDLRTTFGAKGDGATDDSAALQTALNALAADGGGELRVTNGVYKIAQPVSTNFAGKASTIVIRGQGSASQLLIATGAPNTAITVQNLESVLVEDLTFLGTPRPNAVQTDALVALRFDFCLQATIRRCDFYGVSSYVANGAVVLANNTDLRIEDSAFRGCGASAGISTSVVTNQNWIGLTIVKTDFIDYGYLNGAFFSKTPTAPPLAWVSLLNTSTQTAPPAQGAVLLSNVNMDEGAKYALACLPDAASGRIESLTITGLRVNVAGFGVPNDGLTIQGVDHVLIERSWLGYSPASSPYRQRNAVGLRNVSDAVIDACRFDGHADRIVADAACGTVTVRETTYQALLSDAATTQVIQSGQPATVLKADGPIPANSLVVASPTTARRVAVAPAGAAASAILGVALDATSAAGDRTRVVTLRGSLVSMRSDGTPIAPGDAAGPSPLTPGSVSPVSAGGEIGRAVQGAGGSPALLSVMLLDGIAGPAAPTAAALQNGWTNFGTGWAPATYVKTAENRVELSGLIKDGTSAFGTVILNLPPGYRPAAAMVVSIASSSGNAELSVAANGDVAARAGVSPSYTSLDGVRFAAA